MPDIHIHGLSKQFGATHVLKGLDLTVRDGEFLTLLGSSGCGKSTLLRLIAGLDQPDAGTLHLGERDLLPLSPGERDCAMVFQSYALYPHMTVGENICTPLLMRGLNFWQRLPGMRWLLPAVRRQHAAAEASARKVAQSLGIEQKAARDYIDRYFARFAGVRRYMEETKARAAELGYVETVFGRRLYLPEIRGGNGPRRAGAERQAINAPMQGTAADLIKLAMVALQQRLDAEGRASRMVMQVHDELVLEVPEAELEWARTTVPEVMAGVAALKVPLLAEVGVGPDWDKAH